MLCQLPMPVTTTPDEFVISWFLLVQLQAWNNFTKKCQSLQLYSYSSFLYSEQSGDTHSSGVVVTGIGNWQSNSRCYEEIFLDPTYVIDVLFSSMLTKTITFLGAYLLPLSFTSDVTFFRYPMIPFLNAFYHQFVHIFMVRKMHVSLVKTTALFATSKTVQRHHYLLNQECFQKKPFKSSFKDVNIEAYS